MKFNERVEEIVEAKITSDGIKSETMGFGVEKPNMMYDNVEQVPVVKFGGYSYSPTPGFFKEIEPIAYGDYKKIEKKEMAEIDKAYKEITKVLSKADDDVLKIMKKYGYKVYHYGR